jgi:DNA-binding CsgD family transcriptional regulator
MSASSVKSRSPWESALDLSWHLSGCRRLPEVEAVAGQWLLANLDGDYCVYNGFNLSGRLSARLRVYPNDELASRAEPAVNRHLREHNGGDHPLLRHYLARPGTSVPLRMSDIISERRLLCTDAYNEILGPFGVRRQLAFLTIRNRLEAGGYAINRSGTDFPDTAVELARAVQPVLTAVQHVLPAERRIAPEAAERAGLTRAEAEVLAQLAAGLSAQSIARIRRVSPRTVRKQLESIYHKIGLHDRLQVVTYAQQVGLIHVGQDHPDDTEPLLQACGTHSAFSSWTEPGSGRTPTRCRRRDWRWPAGSSRASCACRSRTAGRADQAVPGPLVGAHRRARARGGHLVIVCTREPVLRLIRATGLMRVLDVSDCVPRAG